MKLAITLLAIATVAGIVRIISGDPATNGLVLLILGAGIPGTVLLAHQLDLRHERV